VPVRARRHGTPLPGPTVWRSDMRPAASTHIRLQVTPGKPSRHVTKAIAWTRSGEAHRDPETEVRQAGQDDLVSASLFKHRPEQCPFGHSLALGRPQTAGWKPCICTPAREAAEQGRGMGHLMISCGDCHDELRTATFYEPPHDIRHRQGVRSSCHSP